MCGIDNVVAIYVNEGRGRWNREHGQAGIGVSLKCCERQHDMAREIITEPVLQDKEYVGNSIAVQLKSCESYIQKNRRPINVQNEKRVKSPKRRLHHHGVL